MAPRSGFQWVPHALPFLGQVAGGAGFVQACGSRGAPRCSSVSDVSQCLKESFLFCLEV